MAKEPGSEGFTLIEMLIVIAISAMLASMAIGYGGAERDQMELSVEKTKVAEFVLQARSLALATYKNNSAAANTCGYGVLFNASQAPPNTYSIFAYDPVGANQLCPPEDEATYSSVSDPDLEEMSTNETWQVHPQDGITISSPASMIFFFPPNPDTFIFDTNGNPLGQSSVTLQTPDGQASTTIFINSAGQVNF
jgi:prepilin-type N-terminal cleavage/methylation domain-containing protein